MPQALGHSPLHSQVNKITQILIESSKLHPKPDNEQDITYVPNHTSILMIDVPLHFGAVRPQPASFYEKVQP